MDILNLLLQGFATAGTPVNLLWAFVGCASAPPSACCRAWGRR
jgi:TctA family transporter